MTKLLYAVGTSFLRAFAVAFLMLSTGILTAPNLSSAVSLSIAALSASIAAGIRAVQVFIPGLSWAGLTGQPLAAWLDSFTRAFLGSFAVWAIGWLAAPDWATWHAAILGAIIGAGTAGLRALQGLSTPGETPAPAAGLAATP